MGKYLLSVAEAADVADVSKRTIYLWLETGAIKALHINGDLRILKPSLYRDGNVPASTLFQ